MLNRRRSFWVLSLFAGAALLPIATRAEDDEGQVQPPQPVVTRHDFPNEHVALLDEFRGGWKVTEEHIGPDGKVVAKATGQEFVTWILADNAIRREYQTKSSYGAFLAEGVLSWNEHSGKYEGTWYDNMSHCGPTRVTATWDADNKRMTYQNEAPRCDGTVERYRIVDQFPRKDGEHRVVEMFLLAEGNRAQLVVRIHYRRPPVCPAELAAHRMFIGQ